MSLRTRVMTEKGLQYKLELLERDYRAAQREWSKQAIKLRNLIADYDELEKIRHERSYLETRFDLLSSTFERLTKSLEQIQGETPETDNPHNEITQKYDQLDKENNELLKLASNRLIELRRIEERTNSVLKSESSSRSSKSKPSNYSQLSSTAVLLERKAKTAAKLARLGAEIHFAEIERQKKTALRKTEDDLKRFQLTMAYEIARAELNALLKIENVENAELLNEDCRESRLNEYLETQAKSVTQSVLTHVTEVPATITTHVENREPLQPEP